jgi:hypothetical protein
LIVHGDFAQCNSDEPSAAFISQISSVHVMSVPKAILRGDKMRCDEKDQKEGNRFESIPMHLNRLSRARRNLSQRGPMKGMGTNENELY